MEDATEVMPDMMNLSDTGSIGSKESDSIEIVSISNLCQKSLSDVCHVLDHQRRNMILISLIYLSVDRKWNLSSRVQRRGN